MSDTAALDRFSRQEELVPSDKRQSLTALVIGVGAVGRQVALQLAAVGVRTIFLVDFDQVELHNVTTQGFRVRDVGRPKVEAVAEAIRDFDPEIAVEEFNTSWSAALCSDMQLLTRTLAVFVCVDNMDARAMIWRDLKELARVYVDGRMLGETLRRLVVTDPLEDGYYETTLFSSAQALPGRCTARSTVYTANILAGMMLQGCFQILRGSTCPRDVLLPLLTMEPDFDIDKPETADEDVELAATSAAD